MMGGGFADAKRGKKGGGQDEECCSQQWGFLWGEDNWPFLTLHCLLLWQSAVLGCCLCQRCQVFAAYVVRMQSPCLVAVWYGCDLRFQKNLNRVFMCFSGHLASLMCSRKEVCTWSISVRESSWSTLAFLEVLTDATGCRVRISLLAKRPYASSACDQAYFEASK